MIKVVGVRFRTAGKIYFFDPGKLRIKRGDFVIVETARGIEFGTVVGDMKEVEEDKVIQPLKPVIRVANQRDIEQEAANKEKEKEAYKICLLIIRNPDLCLFYAVKNELQGFFIRQIIFSLFSIGLVHPLRDFLFLLLLQLPVTLIHLEQSPVHHFVLTHLYSPCL